jgi:hypothetical protein
MYAQKLPPKPKWSREQLAAFEKTRMEWILSNREGISPRFDEVEVGHRLPRRLIGPHTLVSFATEYRAFLFNVWGSYDFVAPEGVKDPWVNQDPGWTKDFGFDEEGAKVDPRKRDGLYVGPSRGHVDDEKAEAVGMARAYGYGATMQAWVTDYLAYWAGHEGFVRHVKSDFRGPAFEGDVTYFDAEVTGKSPDSAWGAPLVSVQAKLTNQDGQVLVTSTAEIEVPIA